MWYIIQQKIQIDQWHKTCPWRVTDDQSWNPLWHKRAPTLLSSGVKRVLQGWYSAGQHGSMAAWRHGGMATPNPNNYEERSIVSFPGHANLTNIIGSYHLPAVEQARMMPYRMLIIIPHHWSSCEDESSGHEDPIPQLTEYRRSHIGLYGENGEPRPPAY